MSAPYDDTALHPFTAAVPQADLDDLRDRVRRTRWAPTLEGADGALGIEPAELRALAEHWVDGFDWRAVEAGLNRWPQLTTTIEGRTVHALHARSPEPDALPLVLSHGWPGSVLEFGRVLGPLTDPRAHGGDPADAFHVVAPSLPGFGFSTGSPGPGWDVDRIARAFAELMTRLGYERYGAQGGDWGSGISRSLARQDGGRVVGAHVNMLATPLPRGESADGLRLDEEDRRRLELMRTWTREGTGYSTQQRTRPMTLAHALHDSPVGQLAWIADKFADWTDAAQGRFGGIDRDTLLANVSLYWLTGTAGSSSRIYHETPRFPAQPCEVPLGVAVFPADIVLPVRSLAERVDRVVHWTEMPRGGHFAALEQPELLVDDVRDFFRPLR